MTRPRPVDLISVLRTVSPLVTGVSVKDAADKSTWRIDFANEATEQERAAALALLMAFDVTAPPSGEIDRERDRRLTSGFVFAGKLFQSRLQDQKRIAGAGTLAAVAVLNGAQAGDLRWHGGDSDFAWIAEDNSLVPMDALTVIAFGQAFAAWDSAHVFAARAIKDATPIAADYRQDEYWPARI